MSAAARTFQVNRDDYLAFEQASSVRHEFLDGVVYAMSGGTDAHNLVAGALYSTLFQRLTSPCQAFISDMKLRIATEVAETFYYPDVMVSCAETDRDPLWREQPVFLAEVLSPSTQRIDRHEKLIAYRQIASLQDYAMLAQDTPQIELFSRANDWRPVLLQVEVNIDIKSLGFTMPVRDLYRRLMG